MPKTIEVKVRDLPLFKRLYETTHRVLVERLLPPHEISIQAWNDLIEVHDAIAAGPESERRDDG